MRTQWTMNQVISITNDLSLDTSEKCFKRRRCQSPSCVERLPWPLESPLPQAGTDTYHLPQSRCCKFHTDDTHFQIELQRAWRGWLGRQEAKVRQLSRVIGRMRAAAALIIQKVWRGCQVRKIIDEEWDFWVIKWIWDQPGKVVEVVGDFTEQPWQTKLPMEWCPRRRYYNRCSVDTLTRCYIAKLNRKQGRHELKFVIDGRFVCCGAGTVIEDGTGHYNNIVDVCTVNKISPCKYFQISTMTI